MNTEYLGKVRALLDHVEKNVTPVIDQVSEVCAKSIANGGMLYFFGTGHSHIISEEPFYRAGGLAAIAPILKNFLMLHEGAAVSSTYERLEGVGKIVINDCGIKEGDVIFIISNSGRNAAGIDAALAAKEKGATTVAITSLNHSKAVTSRHQCGKRLFEVCDYVLDNGGVLGDACIHLEGLDEGQMIAPTSTVIDATIVHMTTTATIEKLLAMGVNPPIFTSANTDEGDRKNAAIIAEYKKRVPFL